METTSFWSFLPSDLINLLTATGIGLIVGLEREFNTHREQGHFAGLRTFPLVAITGFIAATVTLSGNPAIVTVTLGGIFLMAGMGFYMQNRNGGTFTLTTVLALVLTFLFGILVAYGKEQIALAAAIIVTTLLSLKQQLHGIVSRITLEEFFAFLKFIVLTLLILPLLPNEGYGPGGFFNPREVGWVVVLISGMHFVSYLLMKFGTAQKGILVTGLLGGLFSSTLISWTFSSRSKENEVLAPNYAGGIILACSVMFPRVLVIVWFFNAALSVKLLAPCLLSFALGFVVVYLVQKQAEKHPTEAAINLGNPLDIQNALLFSISFSLVLLLIHYGQQWMGDKGVYLSGMLFSLADIDATSIAMAKMGQDPAQLRLAARVILLGMMVNTVVKWSLALVTGSPLLRKPVSMGMALFLVVCGIFFVLW